MAVRGSLESPQAILTGAGPDSQVKPEVGARLRAAQEHLTGGWLLQRFGFVADLAAHQAAGAAMADAGPAAEAAGHVARLGKLEQAAERRIPADRQVPAAERDQRTDPGCSGRWVRRAWRSATDARFVRTGGPERLGLDAVRRDAAR